MMRFRGAGWIIAMGVSTLVLAAGCTKSKPTNRTGEESVSSTSSNLPPANSAVVDASGRAPSCGREVQRHGEGYDAAARKCLWDAYQAGRSAELSLTKHTIEGDPITFTIRVWSPSSIEVIEDNRDRFGARGVRRSTCKMLAQSASTEGRRGFIATGCAGAAEKVEVP